MKQHILFFLLSAFACSLASAQSPALFERTWHPSGMNSTYLQDIVRDGNGGYYTCGTKSDRVFFGGSDYGFVTRLDAQGNTVWEQDIVNLSGMVGTANRVATASNGDVIVAGDMNGCDYLTTDGYVARFDANGTLLWRNDYNAVTTDTSYWFYSLLVLPAGSSDP